MELWCPRTSLGTESFFHWTGLSSEPLTGLDFLEKQRLELMNSAQPADILSNCMLARPSHCMGPSEWAGPLAALRGVIARISAIRETLFTPPDGSKVLPMCNRQRCAHIQTCSRLRILSIGFSLRCFCRFQVAPCVQHHKRASQRINFRGPGSCLRRRGSHFADLAGHVDLQVTRGRRTPFLLLDFHSIHLRCFGEGRRGQTQKQALSLAS